MDSTDERNFPFAHFAQMQIEHEVSLANTSGLFSVFLTSYKSFQKKPKLGTGFAFGIATSFFHTDARPRLKVSRLSLLKHSRATHHAPTKERPMRTCRVPVPFSFTPRTHPIFLNFFHSSPIFPARYFGRALFFAASRIIFRQGG